VKGVTNEGQESLIRKLTSSDVGKK